MHEAEVFTDGKLGQLLRTIQLEEAGNNSMNNIHVHV